MRIQVNEHNRRESIVPGNRKKHEHNHWDIQGKTALVTGATAGIGEVTARELARLGARVIVVSRNLTRCATTVESIREETGNPQIEFIVGDLASQAEIRRLAEEVLRRTDRLDVLVNNAGGFFWKRQETQDGIELTWALNQLSYFLLTNLLLDCLKASAPARVINVSSDAHQGAQIHFEDLEGKRRYAGFRAYAQSKLGNILFTKALAGRLDGTGLTANALHPGFVATRFGRNNGGLVGLGTGLVQRFFAISPAEGARTSIYLATSPEVARVTGEYFAKEKLSRPAPAAEDRQVAEHLWQVCAEMTGIEHE